MDEYTVEDLADARHILNQHNFKKVTEDKQRELHRHPDGHEVCIDFTNRYPFNIQWAGESWEYEFSVNGLLAELHDGFVRLGVLC